MKDLRGERELRGLSLRDVAGATSIPVDILASLEAEPLAELRPGSTIARWREQYVAFLQHRPVVSRQLADATHAPEATETTVVTGSVARTPLGLPRALGLGVAVAVVVLLGLKLASTLWDGAGTGDDPAGPEQAQGEGQPLAAAEPVELATHNLSIRAIEPSRLVAIADGQVVHDGILVARRSLQLEASHELSVELPDLTRVKIRYNGQALRPLGNLSAGRRLVFIDDESP